MYMLRDAWSSTNYESEYAFDSSFWTDDYRSQVPYGVDPTSSHDDGIFIVDKAQFMEIFAYVYISHNREDEGYDGNWYDVEEGADTNTFYVTVPNNTGDLYFTAETYYSGMIPRVCQWFQ